MSMKLTRSAYGLLILALSVVAAGPLAAAEPYRVRGTLAAVNLPAFEVETKAGEHLKLALGKDSSVVLVTPGKPDDIASGQFVGITSIEGQGGQRVALEVHIFAEDMRGTGEGHYPWDLISEPNMMTNATIAEIATVDAGPMLTLTYSSGAGEQKTTGSQTIVVPSDAPVVHLAKGEPSALAAGKAAFLLLQDDAKGQPVPIAVAVGAEGAVPPM